MPEAVCAIMATLSTFTLAQVRELPASINIPAASDALRTRLFRGFFAYSFPG